MNYLLPQPVRRLSAYILGVALLLIGIVGFGIQVELENTDPNPFSGFVLDLVFITCGMLTCAATRFRYGGGFWSILINCVGFGFIGVASIMEWHLHDTHITFSVPFYSRVAIFLVAGFIFLVLGEMRRQRLKRASLCANDHAA
jgi:hypothetical protein